MIRIGQLEIGNGQPKICVPLMGSHRDKLLEELSMLEGYDLVEWRADYFEGDIIEMSSLLKEALGETPMLLTFRSVAEGGREWISKERFLEIVAHATYDVIDIELFFSEIKTAISLAHERQKLVLVSSHDFEQTPPTQIMKGRILHMEKLGADICKIAVMPKTVEDVLGLLQATVEAKKITEVPLVTVAMGELGLISRVSGGLFGSDITFAKGAFASAAGQIEVGEMKTLMGYFMV